MLPSTGLFKTIVCPFFEAGECWRPFCHYKHVRPDVPPPSIASNGVAAFQTPVALPVYRPTPKAPEPDQPSSAKPALSSPELPSKRQRLEYVPTSVTTGHNHYGRERTDDAPKSNGHHALATPAQIDRELQLITDQLLGRDDTPQVPAPPPTDGHSGRSDRDRTRKDDDRHKSSSSSRSDKHRSDKSSDRRSSSASSKSKPSSSSKSSSSSSSASSKPKSSSSSSQSKSSTSSSSRSKSSSSAKPSSSRSSSSHSSRSSSRTADAQHSSGPKAPSTSTRAPPAPSPPTLFDSESDEDEVMRECRLIFDTYRTPDPPAPATTGNGEPPAKSADELYVEFDEASRKRRVAYDGAEQSVRLPPKPAATNHKQAAMESVFKRHEIARIQMEKLEARKAAEIEAKEQRLAALEAERLARARAALQRPATVGGTSTGGGRVAHTPGASRPVSGSIAPASAASISAALLRAKQKVEEMRAAKQPTISRSTPKGAGRVAHAGAAPAAGPAGADDRPPPPVLEAGSTKISVNLRMQYYTQMVTFCRTIYAGCAEDAWERAQTVELGVFNKCNTPMIYKKSATLAINALRKESLDCAPAAPNRPKTVSHEAMLGGRKAQNTSWGINSAGKAPAKPGTALSSTAVHNPLDSVSSTKAYDMIAKLRLTDEQLREFGFPRPADRLGWASIHFATTKARPNQPDDRYCARCGKIFNVAHFDDDSVRDACIYHAKSPGFLRGSTVNAHRCCQQPSGSPGCKYADHHVSDYVDGSRLAGFVRTIARPDEFRPTRKDIFALDCEMCYTTNGMELTRVTVVNFERKTVYDALVKPDNKVIDYNTVYSGITAEMLAGEKRTLRDVQAVLLSMFHTRTVLIGHSLESDLKALKLIHDVVVDTSVLFPHRLGPPKKRALKTLCIEFLGRIIQESEAGHDSAEDAEVCIQLVRHYLQNKLV